MGVTFVAILSHGFDNSNILSVPDLLNADKELQTTINQFQSLPYMGSLNQSWEWEDLAKQWTGTNPEAIWGDSDPYDPAQPLSFYTGQRIAAFISDVRRVL